MMRKWTRLGEKKWKAEKNLQRDQRKSQDHNPNQSYFYLIFFFFFSKERREDGDMDVVDVRRKCDAILPHVRAEVVWGKGDDDVVRLLGHGRTTDWGLGLGLGTGQRNWGLACNQARAMA